MSDEDEEFTFEFDDIPKEKYDLLQTLLHNYMDGKISRENYIKEVKVLLNERKVNR